MKKKIILLIFFILSQMSYGESIEDIKNSSETKGDVNKDYFTSKSELDILKELIYDLSNQVSKVDYDTNYYLNRMAELEAKVKVLTNDNEDLKKRVKLLEEKM